MVDARGESESARELADRALVKPDLLLLGSYSRGRIRGFLDGSGRGNRLDNLRVGDLGWSGYARGRGGLFRIVLDGGVVPTVAAGVAGGVVGVGGLFLRCGLSGRSGSGSGSGDGNGLLLSLGFALVGALYAAAHGDGLRVGELDVEILLLNAGKLAMELIGGLGLAHVELGLEGGGDGAADVMTRARALLLLLLLLLRLLLRLRGLSFATIAVKVVEQAEERGEAGLRGHWSGSAVGRCEEGQHFYGV